MLISEVIYIGSVEGKQGTNYLGVKGSAYEVSPRESTYMSFMLNRARGNIHRRTLQCFVGLKPET